MGSEADDAEDPQQDHDDAGNAEQPENKGHGNLPI
jgi:hypothetical protein